MTQDKDKIQRAADALEALGAAPAPDASPQEPPLEGPARPPVQEASAGPIAPSSPPKLTVLARARLERNIALRRTLIPILLTTGLVMVLLGIWSVVMLAGGSGPFESGAASEARYLARLMLLAWPIAIILLGGTAYLMHEVYSHYRINQSQQPAADSKHD